MDALERIRSFIAGFAGYQEEEHRRRSDEQIRAYAGESVAALSEHELTPKVMLRCEFANQQVFAVFEREPTPQRIAATLNADVDVLEAACVLRELEEAADEPLLRLLDAFDRRDAAMQSE